MEEKELREEYTEFKKTLLCVLEKSGGIASRLLSIYDYEKNENIENTLNNSLNFVEKLSRAYNDFNDNALEQIIESMTKHLLRMHFSNLYDNIKNLNLKEKHQQTKLIEYCELANEAYNKLSDYDKHKIQEFEGFFQEDSETFSRVAEDLLFVAKYFEIRKQFGFLVSNPNLASEAKKALENSQEANKQIQENLQKLKDIQENTKNTNQVSHKLADEIKQVQQQSQRLFSQIEEKGQLAEDTRRAIENAIKIELSERYQNRAKDLEDQEFRWTFASFIEFFILFCIGIYEINTLTSSSSFQWIGFIPINIAIVWAIIFTLSKRGEIAKLRYDYAHKEVFASSYLAYQHEINELKGKHTPEVQELITQLNLKLIDSMIDTLADNPAKNLDNKKKSSELPTKEIINLVSEITRIKNLTPLPYLQTQAPQSEESK